MDLVEKSLGWSGQFIIITRVRGQYRYSRYLRDVIGWKLRHSVQCSPVLRAAIATAELFKNVVASNVNKHRKIFASWQEMELSYLENLFSFYKEDNVL